MKTCNYCGETKPLSDYQNHKSAKDGKRGHCKTCAAHKMRNWRKTGCTTTSGLSGKTIGQLITLRDEIDIELKARNVE